jgi:uncharacterized Zn finger protein (UPF0148 family)
MSGERVPVQTGASSRYAFIFALGAVVAGLVVLVASAMVLPTIVAITAVEIFFMVFLGLVGVFVRNGYRRRASDAVFDDESVTFEGGPLDAELVAFRDVDTQFTAIVDVPGRPELKRVMLVLDRGASYVLAETTDVEELESLRALVESMVFRARAQSASSAAKVVEDAAGREAEILVCSSCGAPVMPTESGTTTCAKCGASVAVPDDLRGRVHRHAELAETRARTRQMIARLLRQPRARTVNAILLVAASALLVAPIVIAVGGVVPGVTLLLLGVGGYGVVRDLTLDRRALRSVLTAFGARPPRALGEPPRCHACGAPLHVAADDVAVACVYCEAENVVGANLATDLRAASSTADDLTRDLGALSRSKLASRALVGATLVAGVAFFLVARFGDRTIHDTEARRFTLRCPSHPGTVEACKAEGLGMDEFKIEAGRHLLVCQGLRYGEQVFFEDDFCRAVVCDASSACPGDFTMERFSCEDGLCTDSSAKATSADALAVCLAGAGAPERDPIERMAIDLRKAGCKLR